MKIWGAPEVRSWTDYDEKCDLWSVGCLTYYMLTGKNPPEDQMQIDILLEEVNKVCSAEPNC